jgi:2-phospho-L-lactate transferase/gluconeogenesis factor (CofD/UPF0052 family)
MMDKHLLYFVIGGHGGQVFMKMWQDRTFIHDIVLNVVDWGGSSGVLGRALEKMGLKFLPPGDLRNNVANLLENISVASNNSFMGEISKLLQERVETFDEMRLMIHDLIQKLGRNDRITQDYIDWFLDQYEQGHKMLEDKEKHADGKLIKHNIGNIFFAALANQIGGFENLGNELKSIFNLPDNINFHFIFDKRLELYVKEIKQDGSEGIFLRGEDIIDNADQPIAVKDYSVVNPGEDSEVIARHPSIEQLVNEASLIIIPPGSEGNSYPWIRYYADLLRDKRMVRLANLTSEQNSFGIENEIAMLYLLGIKPIYLFAKSAKDLFNDEMIVARFKHVCEIYKQSESKRVQLYDPRRILVVERILRRYIPDRIELKKEMEIIAHRLRGIFGIEVFNGYRQEHQGIAEMMNGDDEIQMVGQSLFDSIDIQRMEKGLRHNPNEVHEVLNEIDKIIDEINAEIDRELLVVS